MKKFALLTSVLTLAACGGGSGGGSFAEQNSGIRASSDALKSNSYVTSMASEIMVAVNGASPNIVRSSKVTSSGKEYIAYHLDKAPVMQLLN